MGNSQRLQQSNTTMPVTAVAWSPVNRGSLIGHVDVRYGDVLFRGCPVLRSSGRTWVGLPAKPMLDRNGHVVRSDDGKTRFQPMAEWPNRDVADQFSQAVLGSLIRQHGPDVLGGDES
jgi:hypothetical protein